MRNDSEIIKRDTENGSVLTFCIVIVFALTMGAVFALNVSTYEIKGAGASRLSKEYFQKAEMGLKFTMANFNLIFENRDGGGLPIYDDNDGGVLFDGKFGNGCYESVNVLPLKDINPLDEAIVVFDFSLDPQPASGGDPEKTARIEIRPLYDGSDSAGDFIDDQGRAGCFLSDEANDVPRVAHIGPPPVGYGSDYVSRRFSITATAYDFRGEELTGVNIQAGIAVAVLESTTAALRITD